MKVVCVDHVGSFEHQTRIQRIDDVIKVEAPWDEVAHAYALKVVLEAGERVVPVYTRKY